MRKILLLPVKLFLLPVVLFLFLFSLLGRLATNLSAYAVGLFLLLLFILCASCLWQRQWTNAAIVTALIIGSLMLQFGAMLLAEIAGEWAGRLAAFLRA